ncbi:hypothetical protein [Trinickia sp. NRRL B-1857]|uniref:hypothetical protein n=1 Tax=Trinickia sp. NRRL B-1857 TaxID=3162879 RepID=UPI003D270500
MHVAGWYFPVEVDPTWSNARALAPVLERLPKPLWISVYDNSNIGGAALAAWLDEWLPRDVGVFFQDGCGDYVREPAVARAYAECARSALGADRVRIIAEAFRGLPGGGYRAAKAAELTPQLQAYRGYRVYLSTARITFRRSSCVRWWSGRGSRAGVWLKSRVDGGAQ